MIPLCRDETKRGIVFMYTAISIKLNCPEGKGKGRSLRRGKFFFRKKSKASETIESIPACSQAMCGQQKRWVASLLAYVMSVPCQRAIFKDAVKPVLPIGSAHNKGEPTDINIAQISHLSNFSDIKNLVYIHLRA